MLKIRYFQIFSFLLLCKSNVSVSIRIHMCCLRSMSATIVTVMNYPRKTIPYIERVFDPLWYTPVHLFECTYHHLNLIISDGLQSFWSCYMLLLTSSIVLRVEPNTLDLLQLLINSQAGHSLKCWNVVCGSPMCTPVAFSFFPSGLTTIPQENMDVEGLRLEGKLNTIVTGLSFCVGRIMVILVKEM